MWQNKQIKNAWGNIILLLTVQFPRDLSNTPALQRDQPTKRITEIIIANVISYENMHLYYKLAIMVYVIENLTFLVACFLFNKITAVELAPQVIFWSVSTFRTEQTTASKSTEINKFS